MNAYIEELEEEGKIKKEKIELDQIKKQFKRSYKDIESAKILLNSGPDLAYTSVYNSMLHLGRSLMFCFNYRPRGESQHYTVIRFCLGIMGDGYNDVFERYNKAREKRNKIIYEAPDWQISQQEVSNLLDTAEELKNIIIQKIKEINPQLGLF
jgi:uncharacterized protein (UPF0332 family)